MKATANRNLSGRTGCQSIPAIVRAQSAALAAAVASAKHGNIAALEAFIHAEQAKRNKVGAESFQSYQLWRGKDSKFYEGVINPSGVMYSDETTEDGVRRFTECPDQDFADTVNSAARQFGVVSRLETKHATIAFLLERALVGGTLVWVESFAGAGFVTAPHPKHFFREAEAATIETIPSAADDASLAIARELEQLEAEYADADRNHFNARQVFWDANATFLAATKAVRMAHHIASKGEMQKLIDSQKEELKALTTAGAALDAARVIRSQTRAKLDKCRVRKFEASEVHHG